MKILFLGRFPLPVHGASKMNELYFNELKNNKDIKIRKIKINYSSNLEEIGKFNLLKFLGIFIVWIKTFFMLLFFRPNIVYFEIATKGFAFLRDSLYVWLCKLFNRKIIFHLHSKGIRDETKNKIKLFYYKKVLKNSKIIILSESLYEDLKEIILKENIYFVPNGLKDEIKDQYFEKIIKKRKKNKSLVLLFLSNMIESKGVLDVLKICNLLNKDFECLFVGPWKEEKTKKKFYNLIKKYGLEKNCKYLGAKYGKEKNKILEKTNFLLFPTTYSMECYPLVILEAFMFGIPVLAYDNGAIKDMINKNYLGFVSKKKDYKKLYKYLENNIDKNFDYKKIRGHFKENYLIDSSQKKLLKIFRKAIKN